MIRSILIVLAVLLTFGCGGDTGTQKLARARIDGVTPAIVHPGQTEIEGKILGANLEGMSSVNLGDGVNIEQANVVSSNEIFLQFSVSQGAAPGPRMLTIYAAEGDYSLPNALNVDNNQVPRASFTVSPQSGFRTTLFQFDGAKSSDTDGTVAGFHWNFGDGKSASGKSVTHKFDASGTFDVELTITDNGGATATTARFVDVAISQPPIAAFSVSPTSGTVSTAFTLNASQSNDPDGKIVSYNWEFGDGSTGTSQAVSHRYSHTGSFSIRLAVTDNSQLQSFSTHSVLVTDSGGGGGDDDGGGGGSGGSCDANNFFTNFFNVVSFSGNTIVADQSFRECPGLCGEVRRPGGTGIKEFVGDIVGINGSSIMISTGSLPESTRPQPGERLNIVWRTCGS